jgi:hypothetical protein
MPLPETPAPGPLELPALLPGQILIDHGAFYLVYDEETEQAVWVAYELSWEDINGTAERRDNFREDPLISSGSAELDDYRGSGYDRGHLVPAADMKLDQASMDTSFYLSNISPQLPGFNRDIWREHRGLDPGERQPRIPALRGDRAAVSGKDRRAHRREWRGYPQPLLQGSAAHPGP